MTRSGAYSDATREQQLREDKTRREAEAASRRLRKVYAAAGLHQQAGQGGMQQPPQDLQLSGDEDGSDHEFYDPDGGLAGLAGNDVQMDGQKDRPKSG